MREQLEHLNALGAEPHIMVQFLPYTAGAHPGLSGQFSILRFADSSAAEVVHLERFTSDLYLEKPSDVRHYSVLHSAGASGGDPPGHERDRSPGDERLGVLDEPFVVACVPSQSHRPVAKFSRAPRSSVQGLVGSISPATVRRRSTSAWARPAV
jgi:hypothetical protein